MYSLLGSNSMINVRYPFLRSNLLLPSGCSITCRLCFWEYVWSLTLCRTRTVQISGRPNVRSVSYTKRIFALNPKSFVGIDNLSRKITTALAKPYILFRWKHIFVDFKTGKQIFFRETKLSERYDKKHCKFTVDEGFGNEFLRTSYVLPQEECEDRSLFSLYTSQMTDKQSRKKTSHPCVW